MGQKVRGLERSKKFLNNLSNTFVKSTLDKLYHFYKENDQIRILFKGVNHYESYYLLTFKNFLNSEALQVTFDENIQARILEVKTVFPSKDCYNIKMKVINKYPGRICDVMFTKHQVYDDSAHDIWVNIMTKKDSESNSGENASSNNIVYKLISTSPMELEDTIEQRFIRATLPLESCVSSDCKSAQPVTTASVAMPSESDASENTMKLEDPTIEPHSVKTPPPSATCVSAQPGTTARVANSNASDKISFQAGDVLDPEKVEITENKSMDTANSETNGQTVIKESKELKRENANNTAPNRGRAAERGRNVRTVKLMEDMSVPLKCDKAMKMMQGMGWEGGALGARGEGIVVPIMPALDIVTGAGLGHAGGGSKTKTKIQTQKKTKQASDKKDPKQGNPNERLIIMKALLELVTSQAEEKALSFKSPMSGQTVKFIKNSVTKLGTRSMRSWKKDVIHIATKAVDSMLKMPQLFVNADISSDCRKVTFTKIYVKTLGEKLTNRDVKMIERRVYMQDLLGPIFGDDMENVLDDLAQASLTKKSFENLRFRIENLLFVLEFVKGDSTCTRKTFTNFISPQNVGYVKLIVESFNRRKVNGVNFAEKSLSKMIQDYKQDWRLTVEFNHSFKAYSLRKVYGQGGTKTTSIPHVSQFSLDNRKLRNYTAPCIRTVTKTNKTSTYNVTVEVSDVQAKLNSDADSPDVLIIGTKEMPI